MTSRENGTVHLAARIVLFVFVGAAGLAVPAVGQTGTDARVWTTISVQGRTGSDSPWRWAVDSLVRTRDGARTMDFLAEWVTLSRDVTRRSTLGAGYAYAAAFPGASSLREHRFVQQSTWRAGQIWSVSLKSRLEERLLTGHGGVQFRLRQQMRAAWPLPARRPLRGIVSEEVLVKANPTSWAAPGFDANRLFVGIGWATSPHQSVEVGYLNVKTFAGAGGMHTSHVLATTLVITR